MLRRTAEIAADFVETLDERSIWPPATVDELRGALGGPLPDDPSDPLAVIDALAAGAEPGIVGIPRGRYFGFVIGGALVVVLLPEFLRAFADYRLVIYGGLIIAFMMFLPGGLADIGRRAIRFAALRRDRGAPRLADRYGRP